MKRRLISRRAWLLGGVVALVGIAVGSATPVGGRVTAHAVAAIVRARLPDLRIAPAALSRFATDVVARWPIGGRIRLLLIGWIAPVYARICGPTDLESEIVTSFMLGSDLFRRDAGDTRPIGYVGFYDPYTMICGNPFARFD